VAQRKLEVMGYDGSERTTRQAVAANMVADLFTMTSPTKEAQIAERD
jgi:hypothetical protein